MLLEIRIVSRKTPGDGKLEISEESARRLRHLASPLQVRVGADVDVGAITSMTCTCDKGTRGTADGGHEHHFLASALLRSLAAEETVALELVNEREVSIARPHPI